MYIRKNFCAFIRYLEELDPDLTNITSYMRKLDTFLFRILSVRIHSHKGKPSKEKMANFRTQSQKGVQGSTKDITFI